MLELCHLAPPEVTVNPLMSNFNNRTGLYSNLQGHIFNLYICHHVNGKESSKQLKFEFQILSLLFLFSFCSGNEGNRQYILVFLFGGFKLAQELQAMSRPKDVPGQARLHKAVEVPQQQCTCYFICNNIRSTYKMMSQINQVLRNSYIELNQFCYNQ